MSVPSTSSGHASTSSGHSSASSGDAPAGSGHATRQTVLYCPYCAEENLFPIEDGGWECRSCGRAFSVRFLGLTSAGTGEAK